MKAAIFPGSFDPLTLGHVDLIRRSIPLFDSLWVAVGENPGKSHWFTAPERVEMIREVLQSENLNAEVESFAGLVVDHARRRGVQWIVRGLRGVSDYDYECSMSRTNQSVAPEVETVFLMPSADTSFIASRLVREIAAGGGTVDHLVPAEVAERLTAALKQRGGTP